MWRLCVLCLALIFLSPAAADEPPRSERADPPVRLLRDRVRVRMPAGSKEEPVGPNDIMAAFPSPEAKDLAVFESGSERIVTEAMECFAVAGRDFEGAVRTWGVGLLRDPARPEGPLPTFAVRPFQAREGLSGFLIQPTPVEFHGDASLVRAALVTMPDRMVMCLLVCHVDPSHRTDPSLETMAEEILAGVSPGSRQPDLRAGARDLRPPRGGDYLVATVPEGYVVLTQECTDFISFILTKVGEFGRPRSQAEICFGGCFGRFRDQYKHEMEYSYSLKVDPPVASRGGLLLGRPVVWQDWTMPAHSEQPEAYVSEVLASVGEKERPLENRSLSIVAVGTSQSDLAELRRIVDGLTLHRDWREWLYAGGAVLVVGIAALALILIRRHRRRDTGESVDTVGGAA